MENNTYTDAFLGYRGKKLAKPIWPTLNNYKMNHTSRGRAIIFNHLKFSNHYPERKGAKSDVRNLKKALLTLGFKEKEISIFQDLTASDIFDEMKKVKEENHTNRDLLMVFVLTHGGKDDMISAYDEDYSVVKLWSLFTAEKCPTLAGKPKIFFVVACRGHLQDEGFYLVSQSKDSSRTEVDSRPMEPEELKNSIPIWSDFIYVFSTVTGFKSYRDTEEGTWYIKGFCDELSVTKLDKVSFTDFLIAVNGRIAMTFQTRPGSYKQIPIFSSSLTKTLYFNPKTSNS